MKAYFQDFRLLFQFLTRPSSWLIIFFFILFAGISGVIFIYGFDFGLPQRLVCGHASNTYMVVILMSGFLFIATSVAGIGSLFNIVDNWLNRRKFNIHDLWLPIASACLGAISFTLQMQVCG